ncbi:hypothetical protein D6850_12335 [Roseovarius spongiae]|uniref:Hedgehog/Intein (Hint) domain-containing protein n=1 Tax=Roseovarius spongiae TaxID=2320272 RepID=A0A3A8B8K4_9RHOB|nr:Hint domain-containing protein [Roseovarius spongiae]RKF13968.1 hypothetical protein D6850_12335 [Roseovarius spongiae]
MKPKTVGRGSGHLPAQAHISCAGIGPGSIILTQCGETPIERIAAGDRVITRHSGLATVVRVEKRRVTTHAVRILAGSLGDTRPDRDVVLPADQQVLVRDWRARALFGKAQALASARALIDGEFITAEGVRTLTLYALCFEQLEVIYVDGLELAADPAAVARSDAA